MNPTQVAQELREKAHLFLAESEEGDEVEHRVWERLSRVMSRAAVESELICNRYLKPRELMDEKVFNMLTKAIGSHGGAAERAARLVLVQGRKQSEVASEVAVSQQSVWTAVERYRKALLTLQTK